MTGIRHSIQSLAAVVALVMFTGVALPAAAQLCMAMEQPASAATTSCCHLGGEAPLACHDEAADETSEVPAQRHDMEICCLGDDEAAFDEAVRSEVDHGTLLQPVVRTTLTSELPAPTQRVSESNSDERAASHLPVADLNLLYAVMLN